MISEIGVESNAVVLDELSEDGKGSFFQSLKALCFRVLLRHMQSVRRPKTKGSVKVCLQLLHIAVNLLQVLSVIAGYLTQVDSYQSYRYFGEFAKGVRPDLWVQEAEQTTIGVIAISSVLLVVLSVLVVETVLEATHTPAPMTLQLCVDLPLSILQRLLYLPLTLFYFTVVKWSLFSATAPPSQFSGQWKGVLSAAGLLALNCFTALKVCFLYECAWTMRTRRMLAHADYIYELKEHVAYSALSLIFVIDLHIVLSLLLSALLLLYLFLQLVYFQPYYHRVTQFLKGLQAAIAAWAAVSALAGLATDSMAVAVALFVFVAPCLGLLCAYVIEWRYALVSFTKVVQPFWKFELAVRRKMEAFRDDDSLTHSDLQQSLEFGSKLFAIKEKRYYLLQAHYYYYLRDEPEIALLRLTSATTCPGSLISEFRIFHCAEALCKVSNSDERDFVDYQRMFQRCKELDCTLCEMTYDLCNSIINKNTNETLLERSFLHLAHVIQLALSSYQQLKKKFPNDPFVLQNYGSFIDELFHESLGQDLITRGHFELNRLRKTNINTIESYSSVDTGVMIVSCHHFWFGKVIFANEQLGKILGCKLAEIIGKDLDDFIPAPFNFKHNTKLTSFLARGEAREVFRSHLFLSSCQRYSVEVTFRFRPTAVRGVPYFVVAVRPKPNNREFAIFDSKLEITSHSLHFTSAVHMLDHKSLVGESLETVLPGVFGAKERDTGNGFVYYHPDKKTTLGLKFAEVSLGRGTIHWLYVITSEKGVDDLFTNRTGEEIVSLKRSMKTFGSSVEDAEKTEYEPSEAPLQYALSHSGKSLAKDTAPTLNRDTRDEGTSAMNTVVSYAKSVAGLSLRRRANRAVNAIKMSFLAMILLVTVFLAVLLAVVYVTFQSVAQNSVIMDLGLGRLYEIRILHLSRRLSLIAAGLEPASNKDLLQSRLSSEVSSLNAVMDELLQGDSSAVTTVFTRIEGVYTEQDVALATALRDYCMHAKVQADVLVRDMTSPDFFYTYYNGVAEMMHALNRTVDAYIASKESQGLTVIGVTAIVLFLAMATVLAACAVCVGKSLYDLEAAYCQLWTAVMSVQAIRLREIMSTHKDRIEFVHGTEHAPSDQSKVRDNKRILSPPRRRLLTISKMAFFLSITIGFLLFLLIFGYSKLQTSLGNNHRSVDLVSYVSIMPVINLHLLKELYLDVETANSYFDIVTEGQHIVSLVEELREMWGDMNRFEVEIAKTMEEMMESSNADLLGSLNLPYFDACGYLNSTAGCELTSLAKGRHSSMTEYSQLLIDYAARAQQHSIAWGELHALEGFVDMLTEATVLLLQQMQDYSSHASQRLTSDFLTYSCVYVLVNGLLYAFVYLPMIRKLKKQCVSLWRVTTLIRGDFISQK